MTLGRQRAAATFFAAFLLAAGLVSCSRKIGWGVTLWSSTEGPLPAAALVPVYIKSNIENLYVVGVPETDAKVELPLWQVEVFPTKAKARARIESFGDCTSLYLVASRDGLPVREEPTNLAQRVYRLREGESVKAFRKVEGESVSTAGEALAGDWYEVLAEGGAVGYVFSYAMRLFDEAADGAQVAGVAAKKFDSGRVDPVFANSWKPAYFQEMIDDELIDLDLFSLRFGLFSDAVRRQIRIELPDASKIFNYSAITEEDGAFAFADTPLRIRVIGDHRLEVTWTDAAATAELEAAAAAAALPPGAVPAPSPVTKGRAAFVVLKEDLREIVRFEELRQQKQLEAFVIATGGAWTFASEAGASEAGTSEAETVGMATEPGAAAVPEQPAAAGSREAQPSEAARVGTLTIARSRRFTWMGRPASSPGFLPPNLLDTGNAAFRLHLDPGAASAWSGAFSLEFDPPKPLSGQAPDDPERIDFVYRITAEGIELARARLDPAPEGSGAANGIIALGEDRRFDSLQLRAKDR